MSIEKRKNTPKEPHVNGNEIAEENGEEDMYEYLLKSNIKRYVEVFRTFSVDGVEKNFRKKWSETECKCKKTGDGDGFEGRLAPLKTVGGKSVRSVCPICVRRKWVMEQISRIKKVYGFALKFMVTVEKKDPSAFLETQNTALWRNIAHYTVEVALSLYHIDEIKSCDEFVRAGLQLSNFASGPLGYLEDRYSKMDTKWYQNELINRLFSKFESLVARKNGNLPYSKRMDKEVRKHVENVRDKICICCKSVRDCGGIGTIHLWMGELFTESSLRIDKGITKLPKEARYHFNLALKCFEIDKNVEGQVVTHQSMGMFFIGINMYNRSFKRFVNSYNILIKDNNRKNIDIEIVEITLWKLSELAIIQANACSYPEEKEKIHTKCSDAIFHLKELSQSYDSHPNKPTGMEEKMSTYGISIEMGEAYLCKRDYVQARKSYEDAMKIARKSNGSASNAMFNICESYYRQGAYGKAIGKLKKLTKVLQTSAYRDEDVFSMSDRIRALNCLGEAYLAQSNYSLAKNAFGKSKRILEKIRSSYPEVDKEKPMHGTYSENSKYYNQSKIWTMHKMSKLFKSCSKIKEALDCLLEAILIFDRGFIQYAPVEFDIEGVVRIEAGDLLYKVGRKEEAFVMYERALDFLHKNRRSTKRGVKEIPRIKERLTETQSCDGCGKRGNDFKRCSACRRVFYCSRKCQSKMWKTHKSNCSLWKVGK